MVKYWCPHCERFIKKSSFRHQGVCSCGHPHLCLCKARENLAQLLDESYKPTSDKGAVAIHLMCSILCLIWLLKEKGILTEKNLNRLFKISAEDMESGYPASKGNDLLDGLIKIMREKGALSVKDCWNILTPSKKEPDSVSRRRVTINFIYSLKTKWGL